MDNTRQCLTETCNVLHNSTQTATNLHKLESEFLSCYKGLPTTAKHKALYAIEMFRSTLQQHFKKEEALLDLVKGYHDEINKMTLEIIKEHLQLTDTFIALDSTIDLEEKMDTLGKALDRHIPKEERILFPLIQQYCPPEILSGIDLGSL